jgi:large exoprotein involved in heme utilization and adhesion
MNRAYKLVWNAVSHSWVVASELAKGRKKSSSTALKLAVLVAAGIGAGMANAAPAANALPSGESIASGSATFDRTVSNQLTVNQSTSKLITNWNSFDVGSGATVQFAQPDASSIA